MPVKSGRAVSPYLIGRNPNNPRLYFNDERLDQLRTSLQETGILVPLIVYEDPIEDGKYVLMDGERRWRSALDLGFDEVPVNVIDTPEPVDNLLQMFNIHSVREEWSLVAIALSLQHLMMLTGETGELRLAEMTGLTRSTVRRAKRLLSLPKGELKLIQSEAHLDRVDQVHRVDLYLEIERATSVIRRALPEIGERFSRDHIIRQFALKREERTLTAVTDFRDAAKLGKVAESDLVDRQELVAAVTELIEDVNVTPPEVYERFEAAAEQGELRRRVQLLSDALKLVESQSELSDSLATSLAGLRSRIDSILSGTGLDD
jgi:ParB family transcriptional regulator, chromosome partitioning protein